jgi:copper chaperone CopZ
VAITLSRVRQLPGIIEIEGDLGAMTMIVTYDSAQVTPEQISEAVEDIGYSTTGTFEP